MRLARSLLYPAARRSSMKLLVGLAPWIIALPVTAFAQSGHPVHTEKKQKLWVPAAYRTAKKAAAESKHPPSANHIYYCPKPAGPGPVQCKETKALNKAKSGDPKVNADGQRLPPAPPKRQKMESSAE